MWGWIITAVKWLLRKEGAAVAIDGLDRLNLRKDDWIDRIEKRLDECDEDRADLRTEIGGLKIKVAECEEDRQELRERMDKLEGTSAT